MTVRILNHHSDDLHEECGIVAIYSKSGEDVAPYIYRALVALQHRGQDAAGLAVYDGKEIQARRGIGLVDSVFDPEDLRMKGRIGIGHTRYPTSGECNMCDVQPMVFESFAAAHNGHIANSDELRKELEKRGFTFTSTVDSEVMVFMLKQAQDDEAAVKSMMERLEGAFSVAAISWKRLLMFRDRAAIRPLVWGEDERFICFASETVALDINGIPYKGDVRGGELVILDERGRISKKQLVPENARHCMFEYVYFARPDSQLDGRSVYSVRKELGVALARESPVKADVVIPVPDTSRIAAAALASHLKIPCEEGLIKNRYIGRTFIMPDQKMRANAVGLKLNPVRGIIEGKSIVLVDDSIVRGTTLKGIVALCRDAGAREVHLRITCPPIKAPCFYGVDMSSYKELIADKKDVDSIRRELGADSLAYISLEALRDSIGLPICTACLNGKYNSSYVDKAAKRVKDSE
jgi:amidophosphoribosyltransferase